MSLHSGPEDTVTGGNHGGVVLSRSGRRRGEGCRPDLGSPLHGSEKVCTSQLGEIIEQR